MALFEAKYSVAVLNEVQCVVVRGEWAHGYPQPESDFGYLRETYDLGNYCETCGIGAVQKASFRMLKEPAWGKRNVMHLNWVFDEFFMKRDTWERTLRPLGVGTIPVLHHRDGRELNSVVQLKIDDVLERDFSIDAPVEKCPRCGRIKYHPRALPEIPKGFDIGSLKGLARTREYFGSGAQAFRRIVSSTALFTNIRAAGVAPLWFAPLRWASA
jgi:hypothetical protein